MTAIREGFGALWPTDRRLASLLWGAGDGPVCGMLRRNGERLSTIDAVQERVDTIAAIFHFDAPPLT